MRPFRMTFFLVRQPLFALGDKGTGYLVLTLSDQCSMIKLNVGGDSMTDHGKRAEELFRQGYNCAQSVLLAFGDMTGLDDDTAAKLASSFGGGLGRLREVCGAVSGAAMVLGLLRGYAATDDAQAKREHYQLIQEFARRFREENGSIVCRELLQGTGASAGGDPEARTDAYYQKRPCAELVRRAAELVEDML